MTHLNLGFLASHGGTTMQAVIDACESGALDATVRVVISNNSDSPALERARRHGIPAYHLSGKTHPDPDALDRAILETLQRHGVAVLALGGYMRKLGPLVLSRYRGRILNTHPSLLPKFGGKAMYGNLVHEAVLAAGEEVTGATVHLVTEEYDTGPILSQIEVPVLSDDTPDTLARRVQAVERGHYVDVLRRISTGEIRLTPAKADS